MTPLLRRIAALGLLAGAAMVCVPPAPSRAEPPRPEAIDRSALRVCSDPANPPFSNDKGEGFENKIAELLAAKLGVPVRYTWFPNSTGFLRMTLRARRCDLVMGIVVGAEMVQNTNPYYRSGYVLVTRRADGLADLTGLADPRLQTLHLGITAGTPPANLAARNGLMVQARPYPLFVDSRYDAPGKQMIEDLAAKQIDVAVLWGPIAGYFAKQHGDDMVVTPLVNEPKDTKLDFYITMGVRPGENDWKNQINQLLRENKAAIDAILKDYGVPLLDAHGQPAP
jgi:quinoprotein dehydrogenase-associated probable ABC transporter substrate-binding protein